jgi:hypothetical protein
MLKRIRDWIEWKDINLSEIVAISFCLSVLLGFAFCSIFAIIA